MSTSTPASTTQGLLTRSVQAGTSSSSPSRASTSVPEHWPATSCRDGSSRPSGPMMAGSAITSRVCVPLPTTTASASQASSRLAIDSITTPFIERTRGEGAAIDTRQPDLLTRLRTPSAMRESSSL